VHPATNLTKTDTPLKSIGVPVIRALEFLAFTPGDAMSSAEIGLIEGSLLRNVHEINLPSIAGQFISCTFLSSEAVATEAPTSHTSGGYK
jgi:hypothetical protein